MELNFTNRETYLAWRANWRSQYKELSENIRSLKREIVKAGNSDRASNLQRELHYERRLASRMMLIRKQATEHKNAQLAQAKAA